MAPHRHDNMLTLPEVSKKLSLPYRATYDLVLSGVIESERRGRSFLIDEREVERFLRRRTRDETAPVRADV